MNTSHIFYNVNTCTFVNDAYQNNRNQNVTVPILSDYFAIFKNVAHSLEPGETPSYSVSHQAQNSVQRSSILQNNGEITTFKLNGTGLEPELTSIG